ncbi:MAG: PEP-CTERM sorting domain-containing protein [Verrucomicrobiales bacterium]|nr:PEP-CTERM sorting domain-containing protein [Verrucomicrobiales bacterium]
MVASLAFLAGNIIGQETYWALDEEESNRIYGWTNYADSGTLDDYGLFEYDDGTGYKIFPLNTRDIEAMAVSNSNIGYLLDQTNALFSYDFSGLTVGTANRYQLTTISLDIGLGGEALTYNPFDGFLYLGAVVGAATKTDTTADEIYRIDPATGDTFLVGTASGLGETLGYTDGIEFDSSGNLFAYDQNDAHLYRLSLSNGTILEVVDNNVGGGLSSGHDVETLSWDSTNNRMIGIDNGNQEIIEISLANGGNSVLSEFNSILGSGVDFEGSGMQSTVPEPSSAILLLGALSLFLFRRVRRAA